MANSFFTYTLIRRLQDNVNDILNYVMEELIKEYEAQGHRMTGELADSMRSEVVALSDGVMGTIFINDYYKYLDKGVPANRIPFSPNSGKKRSKYIEGLIRFFMIRLRLSEEEAKRPAFATAWKHKREGMPTAGSYGFSNNGKRLDFFTGTILRSQKVIQSGVEEIFANAMFSVISELNGRLNENITITL